LLLWYILQAVQSKYSSSSQVHGVDIEFEDDHITLKLPDLPQGWSITSLIPNVVRECHSVEFDALASMLQSLTL